MTAVHGVGASDAAPGISPERPRTPPPVVPASGEILRRADGVRLIGEMTGSGYRVPPALVRRGDGQTLQLTSLLYAVLHAIDGHRDADQVAEATSASTGRHVTAERRAHDVHL